VRSLLISIFLSMLSPQWKDYGANREQIRERWLEDLEKRQYEQILNDNYDPPEVAKVCICAPKSVLCFFELTMFLTAQIGRKHILTKETLKELLYKFKHWDDIVEKRTLLK
jgi:hypothetical protein